MVVLQWHLNTANGPNCTYKCNDYSQVSWDLTAALSEVKCWIDLQETVCIYSNNKTEHWLVTGSWFFASLGPKWASEVLLSHCSSWWQFNIHAVKLLRNLLLLPQVSLWFKWTTELVAREFTKMYNWKVKGFEISSNLDGLGKFFAEVFIIKNWCYWKTMVVCSHQETGISKHFIINLKGPYTVLMIAIKSSYYVLTFLRASAAVWHCTSRAYEFFCVLRIAY